MVKTSTYIPKAFYAAKPFQPRKPDQFFKRKQAVKAIKNMPKPPLSWVSQLDHATRIIKEVMAFLPPDKTIKVNKPNYLLNRKRILKNKQK